MDRIKSVFEGSICHAQGALRNKEISGVELVRHMYERIKDGGLNAFVALDEERALKRANDFDNGLIKGALAGVPLAIKDNFDVEGLPTTCASRALFGAKNANKNAQAVQRLLDEGAIILGKTNMDEFAMGSSNMTSAFGKVINPLDNNRVCGGSSGGSVCAVAAFECFGALGSDTGGSIRQPASYCGVVGLKPSENKIDKGGMYPLAPSFDQIGPIARTVEDVELLFNILSGKKTAQNGCGGQKTRLRVGVITDLNIRWAQAYNALNSALSRFEGAGCELVGVSVGLFSFAHEVYDVEAYAQMYESISSLKLDEDLLGYEVKKRIKAGLSCMMNPSIISAAQSLKTQMRAQFAHALSLCDVIITPSAPTAAFCFDEDAGSDAIKFSDFFTQPPSICGLSALSVPFYTTKEGLPMGIQIIGVDECEVFAAAQMLSIAENA